ncbi:MAG: DMT family transporter [Planctomycetota bacterium]
MVLSVDAHRRRVATIWLVAMTVVWGSTFFTAKMAIDAMGACPSAAGASKALPPAVLMFLRFALAAIFFPICFPASVRQVSWPALKAAFWMAVACVAGCLFQIVGLGVTTPSMSAFLTSLTVFFTPLVVWLWTREVPSKGLALAVVVSTAGLLLLTGPDAGGWGDGETLNLICAVCFAVQIVMIDRFMRTVPLLGTTWLMFVVSIPLTLAMVPVFGGWRTLTATPWVWEMARETRAWAPLLYLVLPGTVLAIWAVNRFQKDINPTRAAVIYTLEPVFAALFSFLFYGERFTRGIVLGAAVLIAGNLIAELSKKNAKLAAAGADS